MVVPSIPPVHHHPCLRNLLQTWAPWSLLVTTLSDQQVGEETPLLASHQGIHLLGLADGICSLLRLYRPSLQK